MKGGRHPLTAGGALAILTLVATTLGECELPRAWTGKWFQSGIHHLISVNTTWVDTKGLCVDSSGDKFIIEDKTESCFRCLFITENHPNVLQYKETYCVDPSEYDTLDNLCNLISGDATLYLMFRNDPPGGAEPCPFRGAPFTFTYNRGQGECGVPVSRIDSCIQDSRLRIHYQACPDIYGSESAVEELFCLASWKEGSVRYMIGKLSRKATTSDEDRYRCFAYERGQLHDGRVTYRVAQSADASCNGLQSPHEGSKVMTLTKIDSSHSRCRYPKWVTDHHTWHTLDHATAYHFSQKNATLRVSREGDAARETRVVCHAVESNGEAEVRLVAHATRGCNSGYVCMVFYRRDGHVIELQQSNVSVQVAEEACSPSVFDAAATPFTTLITTTLRPKRCPHLGRYAIRSAPDAPPPHDHAGDEDATRHRGGRRRREDDGVDGGGGAECGVARYGRLAAGCGAHADTMEFHAPCAAQPDAYSCHASWEANGTTYLIASPVSRTSVGARRYCFVYTAVPGGGGEAGGGNRLPPSSPPPPALQLTSVTESCRRDAPQHADAGMFNFNLTLTSECEQSTAGAVSAATALLLPSLFFVALLAATVAHLR